MTDQSNLHSQIKHHTETINALEKAMIALLELEPYPAEAYAQVKKYRDYFKDAVAWLENRSK